LNYGIYLRDNQVKKKFILDTMADRYKQAIRRTCRQIRENLSTHYQQTAANKICARIRTLDQYRYAKRIALYQAVKGEIDLSSLWRSAPLQGKYCYFPALNEDLTLSFLPATPATEFKENRFGIAEPCIERDLAARPEELDIIFIPLVAFDQKGTRLGFGAGYYDRTLAQHRPPLLVGVAYEFQRQSFIEAHSWDVPLTAIITESKAYWSKP